MGDNEIELNSHEDIDDLVPIPRVSEKPLDSLDCISKTFDMTITDPLFDFDSEFTLNSDNPIFGIHKWGRVMRQKWRHQNDEVQRIENKANTVTDMSADISVLVRGRHVPVRGQSARNPCQ
ncbi:hypothetical protein Tco_0578138 [Tanacetum coccineum]